MVENYAPKADMYDVAIIGGGVVGCATARAFTLAGAKVVLLEKGADILSGASKANSALMCTGFDATPGSLELEMILAGREEYLRIQKELNLATLETGAMVCAWNSTEEDKLQGILENGFQNGVTDLRILTSQQVHKTAPALSNKLRAALHVPGEFVIDPWSAPLAYIQQAVALGATFLRNAELIKGVFDGQWQLETAAGPVQAKSVVNAAGLYGDIVNQKLGVQSEFQIKPRKGQFVVLDKSAFSLVPHIILPVPNEITKGVVITPTAYGNVLVGPTAEEQEDRTRATLETGTLKMLLEKAAELIPALKDIPVSATYAGLRPATEEKIYRVSVDKNKRVVTLGGIRSTGLSAALGLGQYAVKLLDETFNGISSATYCGKKTVPNICEMRERDWQRPDHGDIVCHCELVTRREIEATFETEVPPGDFGGLRRRTRAGMGRCQGFYCNAALAEMTKGRLKTPLADIEDEKKK